jgi:hypothetical protein
VSEQDTIESLTQKLSECIDASARNHFVWVTTRGKASERDVLQAQWQGVLGCFRLIKALLSLGYDSRELSLTAITTQAVGLHASEWVDATHAGIHGLVGSLAKEHLQWQVRAVDLSAAVSWNEVCRIPADGRAEVWAHREGQWHTQQLLNAQTAASTRSAYRDGGVYVVIGGSGGLGEVFSEHLIRKHDAQLIWIGRRECDEQLQSKLDRLGQLGRTPLYIRADASDATQLRQAYEQIKVAHLQIHGVVHSVVGDLDQSLTSMSEVHFRTVLSS